MNAQTPKLAAALVKVQANLPKLERDRTVSVPQKNGGSYEYSYVTLAHLSEEVLPLLARQGLTFTAWPGLSADGKMCLRYHLLHESGEALTGEFPLSGEGNIQALGGRITYARRYCLAAVVGIAADEDDESKLANEADRPAQRQRRQRRSGEQEPTQGPPVQRASAPAPPLPGEPPPVTPDQLTKIATVLGVIGWTDRADKLRAVSALVGRRLESSKNLTAAEAHQLIDTLDKVAAQPDPADRLTELVAQAAS